MTMTFDEALPWIDVADDVVRVTGPSPKMVHTWQLADVQIMIEEHGAERDAQGLYIRIVDAIHPREKPGPDGKPRALFPDTIYRIATRAKPLALFDLPEDRIADLADILHDVAASVEE